MGTLLHTNSQGVVRADDIRRTLVVVVATTYSLAALAFFVLTFFVSRTGSYAPTAKPTASGPQARSDSLHGDAVAALGGVADEPKVELPGTSMEMGVIRVEDYLDTQTAADKQAEQQTYWFESNL